MTILEIGNKHKRLLRPVTAVFASIVMFNSSALVNKQVHASDQEYLDFINTEAQKLDKTGKVTEPGERFLPPATINPQASQPPPPSDANSFISDVYTKLNSRQKKANSDKYYYLEQLDDEAQEAKPNKSVLQSDAPVQTGSVPDTNTGTAGDDYLSTINAEGHNLNNRLNNSTKQQLEQQQKQLVNITEAQRKELELALESKIPGIFHFYKKLGITQKRIVVNEYLKSKRISTASKTILRLYGGKPSRR